jgi:hypothetical protein
VSHRKWFDAFIALNVVVVVSIGIWFRITSLQFAPEPHGDEAFWGVQAAHLLQGEPVTARSSSRSPMNPFFVGMLVPLVAAFGPSYTAVRVAAAVSGILAVFLTYVLGARALGRRTAIIAATLLAVLPIAIIFSRIAWEPCQVPVYGVLGLYCAFRRWGLGLVLVVAAGQFVHSSTVFLCPIFLAVYLAQSIQGATELAGSWWARWWRPAATVVAVAAIVVPVVLVKQNSVATEWTFKTFHLGHRDWNKFLDYYMKMMLGLCQGVPAHAGLFRRWVFWGFIAVTGILGLDRLVRRGRWDRAALVASLVLTMWAFHEKMGAEVIQPGLVRYGLFLVVPSAWAMACLIDSLLVEREGRRVAVGYAVQVIGLLLVANLLLFGAKRDWFDAFIAQQEERERLWTLRSETQPPAGQIATVLLEDMKQTRTAGNALRGVGSARPTVVVTEDWWTYRPLQFLLVRHKDIKVVSLEHVPSPEWQRIVSEQLNSGGYIVSKSGSALDALGATALTGAGKPSLRVRASMGRVYVVHRVERQGESIARDRPAAVVAPISASRGSMRR